jgi:hypothetical protein
MNRNAAARQALGDIRRISVERAAVTKAFGNSVRSQLPLCSPLKADLPESGSEASTILNATSRCRARYLICAGL